MFAKVTFKVVRLKTIEVVTPDLKCMTLKENQFVNLWGQINVIEQHCCRVKSQRQYLSSYLNISKLWRPYSSWCVGTDVGLKVKISFFRNHINKQL